MSFNNAITIGIDSLPIGTCIHDSYDYSGLQVYGRTEVGLDDLSVEIDQSACRFILNIPRGLKRSCGTPVAAPDFAFGFSHATSLNSFIKKILLRNLVAVTTRTSEIEFQFRTPNMRFLDVLRIPNFAAKPTLRSVQGHSGAYAIQRTSEKEFDLRSNPYFKGQVDFDHIRIKQIQDPYENVAAFELGSLDITSDTAFPIDKLDHYQSSKNLYLEPAGLRCLVKFGDRLSSADRKPTRKDLATIIQRVSFSGLTLPCNTYTSRQIASAIEPSLGTVQLRGRSFTLAYDDFYPNAGIARRIKLALEHYGATVSLLVDDYYKPKLNADLRVSIERSLGESDYLYYSSLLSSASMRASPPEAKLYLSALLQWEASDEPQLIDKVRTRLNSLSEDIVPHIHLFTVPSIYLKRVANPHPLLLTLNKTRRNRR